MIDSVALSSTPGLLASIAIVIVTFIFLKSFLTGPPGPWGLPFLGYYPFIGAKFHLDLAKLAKKYGDVFVFNFAGQEYIHLNSLKAIREAHVTKADCFLMRPQKYSVINIVFGKGAGFLGGEKWRVLRKFMGQVMRHYGIGGTSGDFKGPVLDSVKATLEELKKHDGKAINTLPLLAKMCTWAVREIFFGDVVAEEYGKQLSDAYVQAVKGIGGSNVLFTGNFAKYFVFPWKKELRHITRDRDKLRRMLQEIVDDHKSTLDFENPRDFIDLYLIERKTREEKKDHQAAYFTDEALVGTLVQAFGDGSVGIAFFTASFLRKLSFLPEIQNRMYAEIVNVVGTERLPTWEDRSNLPYTMATLKELLRISLGFPAGPSLECTKDTTVLGVPVSKGQVTVVNMYSIHRDPATYKDPERFDPERFLSDKNLSTVFFGLGKRACMGETMVMQETFVYLASICQTFSLSTEEDILSKQQTITSHDEGENCTVIVNLRKHTAESY